MAIEYYSSIDLNKNELQNAVIQNAGSAPGSPSEGQIYYDSTSGDKALHFYNGSAWVRLAGQTTAQTTDTIASGDFIAFSDESETGDINNKLTVDNLFTTAPALLTEAAIADGDYIVFLDGGASGDAKKEALADLATLFAGTGLGASSSVLSIDAAQTGITSLLATDIKIGEDDQTKIDFEDADTINFYAGNEKQLILTDGALTPGSNAIVDLGTDALEFKDAYFDGTVEADALTIGGENIVSAGVITTLGTIAQDTVLFTSANADDPVIQIKNTNNSAGSQARLHLIKDRGAAAVQLDDIGSVKFIGENDAQESTDYGEIFVEIAGSGGAADTDEAGIMALKVATSDGTTSGLRSGISLEGSPTAQTVDVALGSGTASTVTIAGNLQVNGTTTTVNQTIIESTVDVLVFEGANDDAHETTLKVVEPTADCTFALPTLSAGDYFIPAIAGTATDASAAVTAAEFALLDGGSTVGTTAVADGDGIFTNDGGTMRHTTVQTFQTYFDANSVGGSNIVTTGALNSGSITSGFGNINNGSSTITTTGLISGGSLDIDDVVINGTTIGHTDDTDLMTVADGLLTVAGEISVTTLDIGGTNVSATAAEINLIDGGTSRGTTAVADGDGFLHNDGGTMRMTNVSKLADLFAGTNISASSSVLSVADAADDTKGVVELATAAEVITGTDAARVVTADTLSAKSVVCDIDVSSLTDQNIVTITHNLGTADILVQVYDKTTEANIMCDIARTTDDFSTASTSVVSIDFGTAPPNDCRALITSLAGATAGSIAYT